MTNVGDEWNQNVNDIEKGENFIKPQESNYKTNPIDEPSVSTESQTPNDLVETKKTLDNQEGKYDGKVNKNNMKNKGNIGKNKYKGKNKKRKDILANKTRKYLQSDIIINFKPFLKKGERIKKVNHIWFIKQNSGVINRVIFKKTLKQFLLLNKSNEEIIKKLENRKERNALKLLNMTYLDFIYKKLDPNNADYDKKYDIQKEFDEDGYISYIIHKKDRKLIIIPERDQLLGIKVKRD